MDFQYHSQYQDPSMAQRQPSESHFQHPDALSQQVQESYSNPSSLHSSPRSYPSDLDLELIYPGNPSNMGVDSNPLDDQFSAPPHPSLAYQSGYHPQGVRPKRNAHTYPGTGPLTVSTSHSAPLQEPDTENTARPGNAYKHAQFHSQSLPIRISQTQNQSEILHVQPESEHASLLGVDDDSSHMQDGMRSESPPPISDSLSSTPGVSRGLTRPLTPLEQERLAHLDRLKFFLATAPSRWDVNSAAQTSSAEALMSNQISSNQSSSPFNTSTFHSSIDQMGINPPPGHPQSAHPALNRFLLPSNEYVTCVLWGGLYHITGTDIVRALVFRFEAFGRPVQNMKKFEEGVFSDLRNLKPGVDACLEEPKSPFLDLLFKYQCIRTQKKQKVFYWFSVPHDRLFLDALERDLKREKMGLKPTTNVAGEPAMSFTYDSKKSLYEQFSKASGAREGEGELEAAVRRVDEAAGSSRSRGDDGSAEDDGQDSSMENSTGGSDQEEISSSASCPQPNGDYPGPRRPSAVHGPGSPFFAMFSLNEGSPTYKQRRKKGVRSSGLAGTGLMRKDSGEDRGRYPIRLPSCERPRYPSASQSQDGYSDADIDLDGEYGMSELSAADMFMAQAKGELADRKRMMYDSRSRSLADGVGQRKRAPPHLRSLPSHTQDEVVYHNGYEGAAYPLPPLGSASSIDMNVEAMSISRSNSHEMQMNPYPSQMPSGYPAAAFPPSQDSDLLVDPHAHQSLHENNPDSNITSHDVPGSPKFACPLFSCGRSFKRMEHLKRHLRTHTQERPYQCNKCKKRFSRSDNLNQHLRTHIRIGDGGYTSSGSFDGSSASGEYDEYGLDDGADSEDFEDVEGVVNGYGNGGSTGQALGYAGVGVGSRMHGLQAQMERQTVDEGFLNAAASGIDGTVYADGQHGQDVYYSSADINTGAMLSSSSADGQWSSRPEVSPAFSNISAPSPPPGFVPHIRSGRSSLTSSPANYIRPLSASSSLYNLSNEPSSDYVTSISAPSHKQVFDHASLYPPMSIAETSGPGPIRRHRSMTPSLIRGPEGNRRPVTATGGEFPPINQPTSAGRGYHPYLNSMGYGSANGGSGHSSPAVHPIPLERASGQQVEIHQRSTSNQMPEELAQMMHMHLEQGGDREMYTNSGVALFGEVYRSESPAPFTNALAYGKEAPVVYTTDPSAQGMAVPQNYAGDAYDGSLPWPHEQYSEPNPTAAPAYYSNLIQQQHVTI